MHWGFRIMVVLKCATMAATSVLIASGIARVVERFVLGLLSEALYDEGKMSLGMWYSSTRIA